MTDDLVERALRRLDRYTDNQPPALNDDTLNRDLDPFRRVWLPVCCGQPGCRRTLRWCVIDQSWPRVLGIRSRPRQPRYQGDRPPSPSGREPAERPFPDWGSGPSHGLNPAEPLHLELDLGKPLQPDLPVIEQLEWQLTCPRPRCHTTYQLTNTKLLALLIAALMRYNRHQTDDLMLRLPHALIVPNP